MPERLGKYEILGELGKGGMGVVYKARDPLLDRPVALKTMSTELASDAAFKKRFYREARAAAALRHPNIVTIYELGEDQGVPFIAMEFLEGRNLDSIIRAGLEIILPKKLAILRQVCVALQFAHRHGVVHRDIKPANIVLLPDGAAKVVDFGIARLAAVTTTQTEHVMGTLNYMSPEQLAGEIVDARSDIFSLGTVIYEFLCYRHPFAAPNLPALITRIVNTEPPPLDAYFPACPADLKTMVSKCLVKIREQRYPSLDAVLLDLDPILTRTTQETAEELFHEARRCVGGQQWLEARVALEQVIELDSARTPARTLLEEVRAQIARESLRLQLQPRVESAREMLRSKRYLAAVSECESILNLDKSHPQARDLLVQARHGLERLRLVQHHWEEAQKLVQEGFFTPAQNEVAKLLELEPGNAEAQELLARIRSQSEEREKKQRVSEGLAAAKDLIERGEVLAAEARLEELRKAYPDEPEVMKLHRRARELSERAALERWTQERLQQVSQFLSQKQYARALEILEKARQRNPYSQQVIEMIEEIEEKTRAEEGPGPTGTLPLGYRAESVPPDRVPEGPPPAREVRPIPETKPARREEPMPVPARAEAARLAPSAGTGYPLKGTIHELMERRTRWPLILGIAAFVIALALGAYFLWPGLFPLSSPTGILAGRVTGDGGEPLAGARIRVQNPLTGQAQEALTDSAGAYRFENLVPGSLQLEVQSLEGFERPEPARLTLAAGQQLQHDVQLRFEPARLEGRALDERGRPLERFQVKVVERSSHRESTAAGTNGSFEIAGLHPGVYDVSLEAGEDYGPVEPLQAQLPAGQSIHVDLVARRQPAVEPLGFASLRGRVLDENGKGVGEIPVRVIDSKRSHAPLTAATGSDGGFRLPRLPAGTYDLEVKAPAGYSSKVQKGVALAAGQERSLTLTLLRVAPRPGSIFGRVVDEVAQGVPGVQVRVADQNRTLATLTTGLSGEYRAADLPAGTYQVEVDRPPGFTCSPLTGIVLGAGQEYEALTLVLKKIPRPPPTVTGIKGTVADPRGKALFGATVRLVQPATGITIKVANTDRNGGFHFAGVSPGTYDISVEPSSPIYQSKRLTGIKVIAGQEVSHPVTLPLAPQ